MDVAEIVANVCFVDSFLDLSMKFNLRLKCLTAVIAGWMNEELIDSRANVIWESGFGKNNTGSRTTALPWEHSWEFQ